MSDSKEKPSTSQGRNSEDDDKEDSTIEVIRDFFSKKLHIKSADEAPTKVIDDLSFEGLASHWRKNGFKNIITMVGAGISTSAGIPDFRSPGSGLYDNLQKYKLPHPTAIFELDYFNSNPQPFFALARELYPGCFKPTPSHYFVRLLHEKGLLLRHYTQNIDTLERVAGIPDERLVEAHGTFHTSHCLGCRKLFSMEWMKEQIFSHHVPTCDRCNSIVKPDIVFFGENLPQRFYELPDRDFKKCDLLIIMGTSLEVHPFATLPDYARPNCLRLLINRTKVGSERGVFSMFSSGLQLDSPKNKRDVAFIGDCDDGVRALATALGWDKELKELMEREHARLDLESKAENLEAKELPKKDGTSKQKINKNEAGVHDEGEELKLTDTKKPPKPTKKNSDADTKATMKTATSTAKEAGNSGPVESKEKLAKTNDSTKAATSGKK